MIISSVFKFFVKRVCIIYFIMLIVCFLNKNQRISMIIALTLGVLFSILRFGMLESVLKKLGNRDKKHAIIINLLIYLFSLIIIGVMVAFSLSFGIYTFIAALVGMFSIIIIIMINAITEALGITKNQYGQKVK